MAAQVEVQAGEVGRTGVGGRLLLSPLTDSSNKSLIDIPSIIPSEPNKPVPGPKPRLSPKPFSVDRNPTIKPILAPKPQPKPRPESTRLSGQKPEFPNSPKPQQPATTGKPNPVSANSNRPASTTLKTANKLSTGQTTKPVVHPFKPAPLLIAGDPSKPIPPVPALRQRPSGSSSASIKSFKRLSSAEWSGSTKNDDKDQTTSSRGGPSISRAKSMGSLDLVGQEAEEKKSEPAVQRRPQPRASRPRPVSAIFLDNSARTEAPAPAPRWPVRRPLSADLTSKFESIGLSLHHKPTKENAKENTPEEKPQPQKKETEKTPKSATPESTIVEATATVSDQSNKKTEEPSAKEPSDNKGAVSVKKRISRLFDSSSSPASTASGQVSEVHTPVQLVSETEPAVGVKQLIKQLTVDTTPTQSPVLRLPLKPRPLPLDLTKRFTSEKSSDSGSVEVPDRHDISKDPQTRTGEAVTPSDQKAFVDFKDSQEQLKKAPMEEGMEADDVFVTTTKDSSVAGDIQKVRASLFENVVERRSVMMMDEAKSVKKDRDSPRSPFLRRKSSDEGTLVTATYKEPASPSSPVRVLHSFDTVQSVDESRAVSESLPPALREDKALTLRLRRSEGGKIEERNTEPGGSGVMLEQQPRYLRIGALPKWSVTGLEKDASKGQPPEGQVAFDADRARQREVEQEEVAAAPKRLKMLPADEQPKPKATYFALTGQIQEPVSPSMDTNIPFDDLSVRSAIGSSQGKVLPMRRNPSLDEAYGKKSYDHAEEAFMKSRISHEESRTGLEEMMEIERKRELKKEAERHKAKMKELEREKQRQLALERESQLEFERMKEREKQREFERQRQKAYEKEKFEEKQRALERQKQLELENQKFQELEREKQERERQRQLEKEKRQELERQRKLEEKERQREQERQRQKEEERQRELDRERQLLEMQKEKQKMEELERIKEQERQKAFEKEKQELEEKQRALERQKQLELENQKFQELEREKQERERQRQLEKEKRRELERQRKLEEKERQREQERQRQKEEERQRELDRERQLLEMQKEKQKMEELERIKEQERQQLLEFQKQKQKERERLQIIEMEKHRLREKMEREQAEKIKQMALEQEMLRMRELEKEKERQREMEKEMEREKQRELERQRQKELERERQRQLDMERQELENQRQRELEKERQKKEEIERAKELERRQLIEFEKQKQAERERQQVLELEKRRLREKMEKEEAEKMRLIAKQQEAERQRLKEKQKKEEQERAAALRPKVLDLDSVLRIDPFTKASAPSARWKESSPRAEESYKPSILDIDSFTPRAQASPSKELFPVSDIQGVDAAFEARLHPSPERDVSWKVPTQSSGGFTVPAWTTSLQDPWEIVPVEMSVDDPMTESRKSSSKMSPEHLLFRLQDERVQPPQKTWATVPNESFLLGPFAAAETEPGGSTSGVSSNPSVEQLWLSREPQPPESKAEVLSHRRSHGTQELNRMRSRSVSRRSAPSSSAVEASLSRMRSRSAHREHDRSSWEQQKQNLSGEEEGKDSDTPVRDSDSQYGTWETGLRTDDSLTPATPSSESNLSPSPRKPTPSDTPGDPSSLFHADTVDSLPPSSSAEKELPSFPDAPVALLDTSVLRSRAQLGKKRAPRSRPSRAALQNSAQAEDWLYRDSTEPKSEVKEEDSDSEEPTKGADTPSAVASQPQRVALFPGMDPLALKAQLRKRGESDNQPEGAAPSPPQVSRSPKSPFLPRAARVLPPAGGKENGEEESPQWLKELKSKKRLSQYENES